MISLKRTVAPTLEPVTLDQAKAQCRVDGDDDDSLILLYIQAAREYAEARLGRAILEQTWRFSRSSFYPRRFGRHGLYALGSVSCEEFYFHLPSILLPKPSLIAVLSIQYLDPTGALQTLDPSQYAADADAEPARIVPAPGCCWPATLWHRPDAVQVTYTAGYGATAADVPASVQLAILGLTAHWYENRESTVLTASPNASTIVPQFVDSHLQNEEAPAIFTFED
jgi:hypothetical protein